MPSSSSFPLNEQARRARAAIDASRDSIARSKMRISDSKRILKRPEGAFGFVGGALTDVERGALLEWQQAYIEQREIEREVGRTLIERKRGGAV